MKPEEQRIAIAEACGWITLKNGTDGFAPRDRKINILCDIYDPLPQYTSDLNAMHEAEKMLLGDSTRHGVLQSTFSKNLFKIMNSPDGVSDFDKIHATAAQRAEAFLKTLNLWKP